MLWVVAHGAAASENLYVVLGSYGDLDRASARLEQLSGSFAEPLAIASSEAGDRIVHRVVAGPFESTAEAQRVQAAAGQLGVPDAWLLRESVETPAAIVSEAGEAPPSEERSAQEVAYPSPVNGTAPRDAGDERPAAEVAAEEYGAPVSPEESSLDRHISPLPGSPLRGDVRAVYPTLEIPRFDHSAVHVTIDGRLDEPVWAQVPGYDNMHVIEPDTLEDPPLKTRTQLFYTERGLYVGMWNEQDPDDLVARLSGRDQRQINRDGTAITLDTSGEGRYGYWFGVNLGGSLQDGTVLPERQFRSNWDGPWRGQSAETEDGWTAEYFLPWSMMTMPERQGAREMAFYVSRKVAYKDERWAWPALPGTQPKFMSTLQRIRLDDINPRQQYTLYPYVSATWDEVRNEMTPRVGGDIYWRPTSNFQLSTTITPDFGQVESDDVVVNLTAFETFFPEKRPFFLEGFEIFVTSPRAGFGGPGGGGPSGGGGSGGGGAPTTLVNTRRIGSSVADPGVPSDLDIPDIELLDPTDLYGAAKVVGQGGPLRYGVLTAFEEDPRYEGTQIGGGKGSFEIDGRNFGVARLLYEDNQGGAYRGLGAMATTVRTPSRDANVFASDYHYLTPGGDWKLDGQFMYSHITQEKDGYGTFVDLEYVPRQGVRHSLALNYYDEHLNINDFGFNRRNDSIGANYVFNWTRSNLPNLKQRRTNIFLSEEWNTDGRAVRSGIFLNQFITLYNLSSWGVAVNWFPPRWDDINSRGHGEFKIDDRPVFQVSYRSDDSRKFFYDLRATRRGEDKGGTAYNFSVDLTYQPSDRFSTSLDVSYIDSDGRLVWVEDRNFTEYQSEEWHTKLNMDFFFSAKQQLRLSLQWAGVKADQDKFWQVPIGDGDLEPRPPPAEPEDFAISNMNLQIRYRWEIAPLSDLFIVYTKSSDLDNPVGRSFTDMFKDAYDEPLAEQLVVKLRYRFGN
jgi:hypothetical protein